MKYKWPIIGHNNQLKNLEKDILNKNLSHAYLFSGPEKIGKFKLAKTFAKILQCKNNFCKDCSDCKGIQKENHLDTLFFRDSGSIISIEDVREIHHLISRSHNSKHRILIMENIERMPIPAQNAFLKILEEPPPQTIFLLITNNLSSLLKTVLSRVRIFRFYHLENDCVKNALSEILKEDSQKIENIVSLSQGKIGLALDLAKNFELYEEKMKLYQQVRDFLKTPSITPKFQYIDTISNSPELIKNFLEILLYILRNDLLKNFIVEKKDSLNSCEKLIHIIQKVNRSLDLINKNVNKKLVLENLVLSF